MVLAKKWIKEKEFSGFPKLADFKLVTELLADTLEEGEVLCGAEWLSVDPYMRSTYFSTGDSLMPGTQVARILKSKHSAYPEGTKVAAQVGWRDHTIVCPDKMPTHFFRKMPNLQGLPESYALGALGVTGIAAHIGLEKVLQITRRGGGGATTTIVVSAAGGAVGSVAAQLAKLKGCKVIGLAGSFDKTQWLKSIGIEYAFDYNLVDIGTTLRECAPDGLDYYFDNVGGELSYQVMQHMKAHGKIGLCGAVATLNNCEKQVADGNNTGGAISIPFDALAFVNKNLSMEGFLVTDYSTAEWEQGVEEIRKLILEDKLHIRETILNGFEHMPHALINMLRGGNIGKAVVKIY